MEVRDRNGKTVSGFCAPMILIIHFFCIEKMRSALISAVYWTINWRIVQRFVLSRHLFSCIDLLRDTHRVLRKSQRLSFSTLAPDVGRFTVYLCILGVVLYVRVWSIIIHSSPTITETFLLTPGCLTLPWSQHQWIVLTTFVLRPGLLDLDLCRGSSHFCLRSARMLYTSTDEEKIRTETDRNH